MRLLFSFAISSAILVASGQIPNRARCRASSSGLLQPTSTSSPASSPTSSPGDVQRPQNIASTSTSGALSALLYKNVGSSGTYNMVTAMHPGQFPTCDANPKCEYAPHSVSGPLAPFDEDMTFVLRGPMVVDAINVYQPGKDGSWGLVSKFTPGQTPSNLVFMNNLGGDKSGEFSSELQPSHDQTVAEARI